MKLFKSLKSLNRLNGLNKISELSISRTLALWGCTIAAYGIAYFGLSVQGYPVLVHGSSLTASLQGFFDALYYSSLNAFSMGFTHANSAPLVSALAKSQLALSAGFFTLFVHKTAKSANPYHGMQYNVHENLNRILTKLYIFRYDVNKLLERLEHGTLSRHHMRDFWITAASVDTAFVDLHELICSELRKNPDSLNNDAFKRVIAGVDAAFWNTSHLFEKCGKEHIKWNYPETLQSISHNTLLAEEIIKVLASLPLEKENLYQLRELQKTFAKLNKLVMEKEDIGFDELEDLQIENALEKIITVQP